MRFRIGILLLLSFGAVASAQPATPGPTRSEAPAEVSSQFDNQPIRSRSRESVALPATRPAESSLGIDRLLMSLAIVLGAIGGAWVLIRKIVQAPGAGTDNSPVRIVCRTPVHSRQSLVLIQVGNRLVLASDNGTQMAPLTQIDHPDEVAMLLGRLNRRGAEPVDSAFGKEMSDSADDFESKLEKGVAAGQKDPGIALVSLPQSTREDLSELSAKIRRLSRQFGGETT
jgi:flagellar biogenesis protein FliO